MSEIDWKKVVILLIMVFVIVGLFASTFYLYLNYTQIKSLVNDPQKLGKQQTKELLKKVGALMEVPEEEPTVVTILDKTKLQSQPFFRYAQNGDRVLIFSQAKRAVLYRPSSNKIIDVTGVNLGDNAGLSQPGEVAGSYDLNPTVVPTVPRWEPSPTPIRPTPKEAAGDFLSPTPTELTPTPEF